MDYSFSDEAPEKHNLEFLSGAFWGFSDPSLYFSSALCSEFEKSKASPSNFEGGLFDVIAPLVELYFDFPKQKMRFFLGALWLPRNWRNYRVTAKTDMRRKKVFFFEPCQPSSHGCAAHVFFLFFPIRDFFEIWIRRRYSV